MSNSQLDERGKGVASERVKQYMKKQGWATGYIDESGNWVDTTTGKKKMTLKKNLPDYFNETEYEYNRRLNK